METSQVLAPLREHVVHEALTAGLTVKHNVCLWSLRCQSLILTNTPLLLNPHCVSYLMILCVCVCLSRAPIILPAFDDAIQGQAILHRIKAFSRPTTELECVRLRKDSDTELTSTET